MDTTGQTCIQSWFEHLMRARRLGFQPAAEGWRIALDGFLLSYGETQEIAIGWAYVMSHKSAYE